MNKPKKKPKHEDFYDVFKRAYELWLFNARKGKGDYQ